MAMMDRIDGFIPEAVKVRVDQRRRAPSVAPRRGPEWIRRQRDRSEDLISAPASDFTAVYYAVYHLRSLLTDHPWAAEPRTVSVLEDLLKREDFARQRQGLFLFRQAALTLVSIMVRTGGAVDEGAALARQAERSIEQVLAKTWGHAHRAMAESLGSLPVAVAGPCVEDDWAHGDRGRVLDLDRLLDGHGLKLTGTDRVIGRSRVFRLADDDRILVLKATRPGENPEGLLNEALWMRRLAGAAGFFPLRFDIPFPLDLDGRYLFRLTGFPGHPARSGGHAIVFLAHPDYFSYPVGRGGGGLDDRAFRELMARNAWLLGKLTGRGIVHTAAIPLFHNRVQADRRRDRGRYEWFRAGRLDRWLASCDYPNLGITGLRDLEHLVPASGRETNLYRHIGSHFLSLLLIVGAHFRGKAPERRGLDPDGRPVDARNLFDPALVGDLIREIFGAYHEGFAGTPFTGPSPVDIPELVLAMIEEMGVDRHMEEVLRAVDQEGMSDAGFRAFLEERGFSDDRIRGLPKGAADIVFHSGPHLGSFNRPISLPELIRAVETFSALCMAGRFRRCRADGRVRPDQWDPGA